MDRLLKMRNARLRGKSFLMRSEFDVDAAFFKIRASTPKADRRGISWYIGKTKAHLRFDYTPSKFLARLGVSVVDQFALATICNDLVLLVELQVIGSDGNTYDRNECKTSSLRSLPLPEEIRDYCNQFRLNKPLTGYSDCWVGFDDCGIREVTPSEIQMEDFDVGFD